MFKVIRDGKDLPTDLYTIDYDTKTFSSEENNLIIEACDNWTFKTDWDCSFDTGGDCSFNTGGGCTFKTGWSCSFKTDGGCSFKTGAGCTFKTGEGCTFNVYDIDSCSFNIPVGLPILDRYSNECIITDKEIIKLQLLAFVS